MRTVHLNKFIRRYTSLSSALDTLMNKKLVLMSPSKWDDTNDVEFMDLYRAHAKVGAVLALCCAKATETYHHWRVFTQGLDGVCIEFDRRGLQSSLARTPGLKFRAVDYLLVKELTALRPHNADRLPFVKRVGYRDEREWRIVATHPDAAKTALDVPIDLGSITRLVFNPWMPPPLADNLRGLIRGIPDCDRFKIESSALTNSPRWKAAGKKLAAL